VYVVVGQADFVFQMGDGESKSIDIFPAAAGRPEGGQGPVKRKKMMATTIVQQQTNNNV
jgi:hypothetical protein